MITRGVAAAYLVVEPCITRYDMGTCLVPMVTMPRWTPIVQSKNPTAWLPSRYTCSRMRTKDRNGTCQTFARTTRSILGNMYRCPCARRSNIGSFEIVIDGPILGTDMANHDTAVSGMVPASEE